MTYADRVPAPRPVPTTRQRLTDARGCGHTPEQHRHQDGQDADDRSADRAIRELTAERDGLRDDIQRVEQTRQEQVTELRDRLAAMTEAATDHRKTAGRALSDRDRYARTAADLLAQRNEAAAQAEVATDDALRLAAELTTARQDIPGLLAKVDELTAELERAREAIKDCWGIVKGVAAERNKLIEAMGRMISLPPEAIATAYEVSYSGDTHAEPEAPLGSVSPHAQDALADRLAAVVVHLMRLNGGEGVTTPTWQTWEALLAEHANRAKAGGAESEQVLRDRIEHAIRAGIAELWPTLRRQSLDRVAAVAAVAAVNELRQG